MILTGAELERQIALKRITIDPFCAEQVNPNSYNYRIGDSYKVLPSTVIDPKEALDLPTYEIPPTGLVLEPNRLYLANTLESIGSDHYVPSLIGRSSMGRLGLYLQVSADLGQIGTQHNWTLELVVTQPLRIYPLMIIGQVTFWCPEGERSLYAGRYHGQRSPGESKAHYDYLT